MIESTTETVAAWLTRALEPPGPRFAASRGQGSSAPSSAPPPLRRVRVLAARTHREADRHAEEAKGLAQPIDEIALVAFGDVLDRIAEQHEERRARLGLGDVTDLHPPPGDGGRRRRV